VPAREAFIYAAIMHVHQAQRLHRALDILGLSITIPAPGEVNAGGGLVSWERMPRL